MQSSNLFNMKGYLKFVFVFTCVSWMEYQCITHAATIQDLTILDQMLKSGYDRRATPTNHLNNTIPTKVWCELFVRSFGSPNPLTMDYKVDLYLRQKWVDERLKHEDLRNSLDLNDPNLVKAIWKPEVYFPNAKDADFQFVTVPNVLVRINPDGEILYMLRLKVTFSCMMDLSKFPLDRQTCTMEVASFSKTMDELILEWKPKEPITTASLGMTQFDLVDIVATKCKEAFQIGNYSCLRGEFHLSRLLGFHLVQSYLPTILMVVISWVSFWMDVNSVPGRVTLGVTTLLTVSSKATNINIESSYVKAIDVWMGTCTAFVFLALLEFTIVNYLWRRETHRNFRRTKKGQASATGGEPLAPATESDMHSGTAHGRSPTSTLVEVKEKLGGSLGNHLEARFIENPSHHFLSVTEQPKDGNNTEQKKQSFLFVTATAKSIDETCRYVFPITFTLFIIVYFVYYLII